MIAHVLVSGVLFRDPEARVSRAGKSYATATIRAKDGDATTWWRVTAFSERACAELMRLSDGDALSAQGALRVETYEKDGSTRVSFGLIANCIVALRQPAKPHKMKQAEAPSPDARSRAERLAGDGVDVFGDEIPI